VINNFLVTLVKRPVADLVQVKDYGKKGKYHHNGVREKLGIRGYQILWQQQME
jgi:hypothetical protein